jgi:hypothetical protein
MLTKQIVFVLSIRDLFELIFFNVSNYDFSEDFSHHITTLLFTSVTDEEPADRGTKGHNFETAESLLKTIVMPEQEAFQLCSQAIDFIINKIALIIPDFSPGKYAGKYSFTMRNTHDVLFTFHN